MLPTPEQAALLRPLLAAASASSTRGRPPQDDLAVLPAILWKLSTNTPWEALPAGSPSAKTCYRRYQRWQRSGLLKQLLAVLYTDLATRGGLDIVQAFQDGRLTIRRIGACWVATADPALAGTWQLATARIFVWFILKYNRRHAQLRSNYPTRILLIGPLAVPGHSRL